MVSQIWGATESVGSLISLGRGGVGWIRIPPVLVPVENHCPAWSFTRQETNDSTSPWTMCRAESQAFAHLYCKLYQIWKKLNNTLDIPRFIRFIILKKCLCAYHIPLDMSCIVFTLSKPNWLIYLFWIYTLIMTQRQWTLLGTIVWIRTEKRLHSFLICILSVPQVWQFPPKIQNASWIILLLGCIYSL